MSEIDTDVVRRLVTGRKSDGRAVYDPQAKAEVVRACLKPGVSVARMALQCGINANLLRRWITQSIGADMRTNRAPMPTVAMAAASAFVPLRLTAPEVSSVNAAQIKARLHAHPVETPYTNRQRSARALKNLFEIKPLVWLARCLHVSA